MRLKYKRAFLIFLLLGALLACYSIIIEPRWLQITQQQVALKRLPPALAGLRVAHLTDLHYPVGLPDAYYAEVVQRTNALKPDLIVLTGDFVARAAADAEPCGKALAGLRAPLGVYAVLGNHDYWTSAPRVAWALEANGIRTLINQAVPIRTRGARLWLIGLDDAWSGHPDLPRVLCEIPHHETKIVLVHEPDYADTVAQYPIDLQLSGHSHGGQVRVPLLTRVILPYMGRKYPIGLRQVGEMPLYTGRGVGGVSIPVVHWPVRFRCRPEIALLTLRAER